MKASQFNYEINLKIGKTNIVDVNYLSFIRAPFYKTTTQTIIKCFMSQILIQEMIEKISSNKFPEVEIKIYMVDEIGSGNDKKIDIIYNQSLICIGIFPEGLLDLKENSKHVKLVLTHPILYYMSTTNVFNVVLENLTSYKALQKFEVWLNKNFGDIFDFKHFGHGTNKNNFQYEQILIRVKDDLNVPNFIIDTYKPHNNLCWYFFDYFIYGPEVSKEITNLYINLSDLAKQKSDNINKYPDSQSLMKIVGEFPINDLFKKYDKEGHSLIYDTREIKFDHVKTTKGLIPKRSSDNRNVELTDGRKINVLTRKSLSKQTIQQSSTASKIYVPDSLDQAIKRFENNKNQILKNIRRIVMIEITNGLPNFPEFGKKYDIEKKGNFKYTPLAIINNFIRKVDKEHFCSLINQTMMINFR